MIGIWTHYWTLAIHRLVWFNPNGVKMVVGYPDPWKSWSTYLYLQQKMCCFDMLLRLAGCTCGLMVSFSAKKLNCVSSNLLHIFSDGVLGPNSIQTEALVILEVRPQAHLQVLVFYRSMPILPIGKTPNKPPNVQSKYCITKPCRHIEQYKYTCVCKCICLLWPYPWIPSKYSHPYTHIMFDIYTHMYIYIYIHMYCNSIYIYIFFYILQIRYGMIWPWQINMTIYIYIIYDHV